MKLGIVGHAADKFTPGTEALARDAIRREIVRLEPSHVVSGGCHLGGVDIYAEEIARDLGVPTIIHPAKIHVWGAPGGYKERNLAIARDADKVIVVVVNDYPNGYMGMRFNGCYHCKDRVQKHVKSGGCWTAWKARSHEWIIVSERVAT